jgi:hypothetical protein
MMSQGASVQERSALDDGCFGWGHADAKGRREAEGRTTTTGRRSFGATGEGHSAYGSW